MAAMNRRRILVLPLLTVPVVSIAAAYALPAVADLY